MPNMTLAIPNDLHKIIRKHSEIKWSEVARRAMWSQARKMQIMDKLVTKSTLTEDDVTEIDKKLKADLLKRFKK